MPLTESISFGACHLSTICLVIAPLFLGSFYLLNFKMKNTENTSKLRASNNTSHGPLTGEQFSQQRSPTHSQKGESRIPTQFLKVETLIRKIRKATDLAHRIDWPLLTDREHHNKVIDISQLVINDLFQFLGQ